MSEEFDEAMVMAKLVAMDLVLKALVAQSPDKAKLLRLFDTLAATIQYRSIALGVAPEFPTEMRAALDGWRDTISQLADQLPPR